MNTKKTGRTANVVSYEQLASEYYDSARRYQSTVRLAPVAVGACAGHEFHRVNSIAQERSTLHRSVNLQLFYCAALRSIALIWIKQMLEWRDRVHAAKEKASAPRWLGG